MLVEDIFLHSEGENTAEVYVLLNKPHRETSNNYFSIKNGTFNGQFIDFKEIHCCL